MDAGLATEMEQLKQKSIQDMDAELVTRIQILESEINEEEKPDDVVKRETSRLMALSLNLNNSKERKTVLTGQIEGYKGKMEGGLENFDIDKLIKQKLMQQKELSEQKIQIEGSRIAARIFSQMAEDTSVVFKNLSARASKKYGALLPTPKNISITSITSDKEIMAEDAGGTARYPDHLSRGTRDLFYFALRLTLAESSSKDGKVPLLVLDEPFHSFDEPRTTKALELLQAFQNEHGSQIIMFSKDKTLEKTMKNIFGDKLSLEKLV
jgi:DNA repair exonuclease SbcCD ATPase subunit